MSVSLLGYGAVTQGWWLGDVPLILGYENPQNYLADKYSLGAIVGRVANRIGNARFEFDGVQHQLAADEGPNTLHGGQAGLSCQNWTLSQITRNQAVLTLTSPDGDGGFPGNVDFQLRVTLSCPRLTYEISAMPDRPTPISIAQHNYYSLGSARGISQACLKLSSGQFLELDGQSIPTGHVRNAAENGFDFAVSRPIGSCEEDLDHYFVFALDRDQNEPIAEVMANTGLGMKIYSDQPGVQVYSAAHLSDPFPKGAGLCVEPSGYPNAPNIPTFPSMIYTPENPYHQMLTLEITGDRT